MSSKLLGLRMTDSDEGEKLVTLKQYLIKLLTTLWREAENFSGKRPFGNSGWQYYVYVAMIRGGLVPGKLDENGYVEEIDTEAADKLILEAIESL